MYSVRSLERAHNIYSICTYIYMYMYVQCIQSFMTYRMDLESIVMSSRSLSGTLYPGIARISIALGIILYLGVQV